MIKENEGKYRLILPSSFIKTDKLDVAMERMKDLFALVNLLKKIELKEEKNC